MEEAKAYVAWEEVVVSNDKGRRVVHYYLKDGGGGADLAVVGKERSVRHMSYAAPSGFLRSLLAARSPSPSRSPPTPEGLSLKWRSRREVIDWLSSLVSGSYSYGLSPVVDRYPDEEVAEPSYDPALKGQQPMRGGHHTTDFSWLGHSWNCRKRRKHYRSFSRRGITFSVHDFVYVMAEEYKRLIAYVEDLYEDSRANNMVVVRWFHKVDEVGIVLPPDVKEREIFFTHCLQDLSVECIDGLAAILSPQHFEKFQNETRQSKWQPYLCRYQIDNDDVKPFHISQVQGYWSQEVLRTMFTSSLKLKLKITCNGSTLNGHKRKRNLISDDNDILNKPRSPGIGGIAERQARSASSHPGLLRKEVLKQKIEQKLSPGNHVEVLSQDSGMRGCWFRCVILKRYHDKVKVQYQDVKDADETGNLQEWVFLSRLAAPDNLGIRLCGRPVVRPQPLQCNRVSLNFDVGAVVDAWWHDGWWEGIVIHKDNEGKIHVYFPGEKRVSVFNHGHLRHSQDWIGSKWNHIKDRKDTAGLLFSKLGPEIKGILAEPDFPGTGAHSGKENQKEGSPLKDIGNKLVASTSVEGNALDLTRYCRLDGLKWRLSRKRKRREFAIDVSCQSKRSETSSDDSSQEKNEESNGCDDDFVLLKSLTVDRENCKIGGDPLFSAPMIISNLVMTR